MKRDRDETFLAQALGLAAKGIGRTSPNPAVGAVIVRNGRVIGEGFHRRAGLPHAEIEALRQVRGTARGATMYVTLEPCSHFGRTPPCADALVEAGITRVVVGMVDPNPQVRGRGIRRLRRAGIEVKTGVLKDACLRLNEDFIYWVTTKKPFVTLKLAASLDGRIATASGDSQWISGEQSRRVVHAIRNRVDAVLVGAETVRTDNPRLTCRMRGGRDPVRVIVDGRLTLDPESHVCTQRSSAATVVFTSEARAQSPQAAALTQHGVEVVGLATGTDQRIALRPLLKELGQRGIKSVLIEGGGQVAASALREGVVNKVLFFYAPLLLGGEGRAMIGPLQVDRVALGYTLHTLEVERSGNDVMVSAYVGAPRRNHVDRNLTN
ncbi:MAG: bifunctional diaminohydroxyphosphoribosylaminopyrimidine deaminase/5-amino-6-(5-phosphoribosylamino)uracil reductase RibD [Deltaproteobacteria bacterium]|nr:bifunctional diaminohydroxyphosphoribosylaminopyrimidine deaminase/5-amino-6-(5-phosphoribosylamino)uracil reductase RibD [Deltaproteobacteria bacterium]